MVVLLPGVLNVLVPVANGEPPVAFAYQSIVSPAPAVAEIATLPPPHIALLVPVGATGNAFTVMVIVAVVAH